MTTRTVLSIAALATLGATAVYADTGIENADRSGDGFVSLDEFKIAHSARVEEKFSRMDADGDGLLSADEMEKARKAKRGEHRRDHRDQPHGNRNPAEMFERLDSDASGGLSPAELEGRRLSPDAETFESADADGNGELDAAEMHAMMMARRDAHRGMEGSRDD